MPDPKPDPNLMRIITREGVITESIPDKEQRSVIGRHANAVQHFLATGEAKRLRSFRRTTIAGHRLQTDLDALEAWAAQGELEFEDVYDSTGR